MIPRICGTCEYGRNDGDCKRCCTHDGGHRFTTDGTHCINPRRWWKQRHDLVDEQDNGRE